MTANQITGVRHLPFATQDRFQKVAGDQDYAREQNGITAEAIFGGGGTGARRRRGTKRHQDWPTKPKLRCWLKPASL